MKTDLMCECCGQSMSADMCDNVACINKYCLLFTKCYSYNFYEGRVIAKEQGLLPQQKELIMHGWAKR